MARLRYLENAREGDKGTVCTHNNKLFFDDTSAYIRASASGVLALHATTVTVSGHLTVTGDITGANGVIPYTTDYMGTLNVGVSGTGYAVNFYGTSGNYWKWDGTSAVEQIGTTSHTGDFTMESTSKLYFYDNSSGYIRASGDEALEIVATTSVTLTTPTFALDGAMTSTGAITISAATIGPYLDFNLLNEYISGTFINADFSEATTFTGGVVGILLNFNTNVTMITDEDVTAIEVKLPAFTQNAGNTTYIVGYDLSTAGTITSTSGIIDWRGVNLQLPTTAEAATVAYGMYINAGTLGSATQTGIYISGAITNGIVINAAVTGLTISGASAGNAIKIAQTGNTATSGYAIAIGTSARLTTSTDDACVIKIYANTTATGGDNRGIYNRFYFKATNSGGGESLRSYTLIEGAYSIGTAHGAHISLGMGESGTVGYVTGLGVATRSTLGLPNNPLPSGGTYAAIMPEIWSFGTNSDAGAVTELSFIRCVNGGNSGGISDVDDDAFLLVLDGGSDATGKIFYHNTLRIKANSLTKYIPLSDTEGAYTIGTMANTTGSGVTITDDYSKMIGIYCDATANGSTVGAAAHELYGGEVRQLLTGTTFEGEQYSWKATQRYYGTPQIDSYSAALHGKLESAGTLAIIGYAGCVLGFISDGSGAGTFNIDPGGHLYGFCAQCNFDAAHDGVGTSAAYMTRMTNTHNWDIGLALLAGTVDTGIDIASATTGIDIGATTTGISFTGAAATTCIDLPLTVGTAAGDGNAALIRGGYASSGGHTAPNNPVAFVTANQHGLQFYLSSTTGNFTGIEVNAYTSAAGSGDNPCVAGEFTARSLSEAAGVQTLIGVMGQAQTFGTTHYGPATSQKLIGGFFRYNIASDVDGHAGSAYVLYCDIAPGIASDEGDYGIYVRNNGTEGIKPHAMEFSGGFADVFSFGPVQNVNYGWAWNTSGTCSTEGGWYKVRVCTDGGGATWADRYVQLWTTAGT